MNPIIILIILVLACISAFLQSPVGRGWLGEANVKRILLKNKKGKRFVINNYMVVTEGKSSQIDHILINQNGVFIIETKNYSGRIYGNEKQLEWTQVLAYGKVKNKLYNPLKQNATHCYRLAQILPKYKAYFKPAVVLVQGNIEYIEASGVYTLRGLKHYIRKTSDVFLT